MNILITGANGFIGKNLISVLEESKTYKIIKFTKEDGISSLDSGMRDSKKLDIYLMRLD